MTGRVQVHPSPVLDFSPTEVQDWMLCPSYWRWRYVERWLPKTVGTNEVQAWIGRAVHAGIAAWCLRDSPLPAASLAYNRSVEEATALGRDWEERDEYLRAAHTALRLFTAQAPEWLQTACRGVEVTLGRARLDWIGRPDGEWCIVDFKTKKKKPYNVEAYQWELRRSWQMAEYVERARTHPASPAYGGVVTHAEVQTIILDPFEVLVDTFTPTMISDSERDHIHICMNAAEFPLYGFPQHPFLTWRNRSKCRNWFGGDCPYLRACWEYEGDPQRLAVDYVKNIKEKRT